MANCRNFNERPRPSLGTSGPDEFFKAPHYPVGQKMSLERMLLFVLLMLKDAGAFAPFLSSPLRHLSITSASDGNVESPRPQFVVIGGGSFGIAIAFVLAKKGVPTTLLVRDEAVANCINSLHKHPSYLSDLPLPPSITATTEPREALSAATHIVHAVPVQFTREYLKKIKKYIKPDTPLLSVSKGIETKSGKLMTDLLEELLGTERTYAFLSGPSFAREIVEGKATAVVVASADVELATELAHLMSSSSFRVFTSRDVIGVEVGGAVKNVIAVAAGMALLLIQVSIY